MGGQAPAVRCWLVGRGRIHSSSSWVGWARLAGIVHGITGGILKHPGIGPDLPRILCWRQATLWQISQPVDGSFLSGFLHRI